MKCSIETCRREKLCFSDLCWEHINDKTSYVKNLPENIQNHKSQAACNLKGANLSCLNLSGLHLFDACLEGADLVGANLSGCDLTHCNLSSADLTKANLTGSRLWSADMTGANLTECELESTDLWNAKMFNVKLWHANFRNARSLTKLNFSGGQKIFDRPGINESGILSAEDSYRDLKAYFLSRGMYNDASWASFKEKTMERLILKKNGDFNYFPSLFMSLVCGYGEKPYRIILTALFTIFFFAALFFSYGAIRPSNGDTGMLMWSDYIYYSTITFTTVGYGDIIPKSQPLYRFMASCEAFMGVFLTGLFIFTLARKYSAR
jgi:hypothetical protein